MTDRVDELLHLASQIGRGVIPPFEHNDCYTAGAFDLLLVNASGPDAFELLNALCERYAAVEPSLPSLVAYFDLLAQVARQSQTTELPTALPGILARHPDLAAELRAWYRLEA